MKINSILSVFAPKDVKFLPMLRETTEIMVQSAVLLQDLFTFSEKEQRHELCKLIKAEELNGDRITNKIFKSLNETFITPFDREDIDSLADCMDDVIDVINRVAQKMILYSPENLPQCTIQLTEIIHKGVLEVRDAVADLDRLKKTDTGFKQHYRTIKKLEEDADAVYEHGIRDLFKEETNTIELIKIKEIIQELEKAANKVNNTGKVLKTIYVKYA